jgi:RES domain
MSFSIWTECAGGSEVRPLRREPWRVVESQHQVSTRKLVDTNAEQELLEALLEGSKPPDRTGGRLHYLLSTPFRYGPLSGGTRFGSRLEAGIWYGSEEVRTALAEVAYYRLLFLAGSEAVLGRVEAQLTAFRALVATAAGLDLTAAPFARYAEALTSPVSYAATHALGREMRAAGVEAFRFVSARDVEGGVNVGVTSPAAFGGRDPWSFESWYCVATPDRVDVRRRDFFEPTSLSFPRSQFLVDGVLPAPSLQPASPPVHGS